ncbi:hypothetical protein [Cohnella zeiphila]|uniref:Uncharacterized protein n=1 Tax=Cohnella zeiphila TaxID=2761120 RepID=A0A7X0VXF8_9BACL|nr:hypothetical protein [Cohnella zeiphila]MBB6733555.1 hypothetical protein [Cohnella zeiphila]
MILLLGLAAIAASEWIGRSRQERRSGRAPFIFVAAGVAIYEWVLMRYDWLPFLYYPFVWLKHTVGGLFSH